MHLWEVKHPHYCVETNYFKREVLGEFISWQEFFEEFGDAQPNYNFLLRFDWDEDERGCCFTGDDNYRNGVLKLYWLDQSKGLFTSTFVQVCRSDEPAVIEFLQPFWNYMNQMWAPISDQKVS